MPLPYRLVKISDDPIKDGIVICATCGAEEIHQYKTEIFERSEDGEKPLHCIIEGSDTADGYVMPVIKQDRELTNCPSPRRSGINIYFWCENCDCVTKMSIYQHKGRSFVEFHKYDDIDYIHWSWISNDDLNAIIECEKNDYSDQTNHNTKEWVNNNLKLRNMVVI